MTSANGIHPFAVKDADSGPGARTGLPVVVIGGGPVGLAAAAHLLDRGLEPLVLEAGPPVGPTSPSGSTCGCSPPGAWPWIR
jgi:NADPH-dependent 2,4-dienoyl-CoA reductase/sulfur reductase-like enzyme